MAAACQLSATERIPLQRINPVHWYCLHTKPLKEDQVVAFCSTQLGLETYYPRVREHRTIRRKRCLVVRPLFPRYLFCRFEAATLFRAVRYAPEVSGIVSIGSTPTIVAPQLLDELKSWAGNEVDILTVQPTLRIGDRVELTAGPLQGLSGIIMKESEESIRVTILLSFLQNGTHVNVDRTDIRLIA